MTYFGILSLSLIAVISDLLSWRVRLSFPSEIHLFLNFLLLVALWFMEKNSRPAIIFIAVCVLIVFGTPLSTTAGDARYIWFFHAKRIYIDNDLFAQLDNYAEAQHNDYPVLIPAIAASIARRIGYWNEVFPRTSILVIIIPTILCITLLIRSAKFSIIWISFITIICNKLLLNGYMDGILALVLANIGILYAELSNTRRHLEKWQRTFYQILVIFLTFIMPHIKNEGMLAVLIFFVVMAPLSSAWWLPALSSSASITGFFLLWRLPVINANIQTDLFDPGIIWRGILKLFDPESLFLLIIWFTVWSLPVLFVSVCHALTQISVRPAFRVESVRPVGFALLYVAAMFVIYLITPNDLKWHLETSMRRVMVPVSVYVCTIVLYDMSMLDNST